jgi:hypothetical protein
MYTRKEEVRFRKDGSIKSKSIIESKEHGSLLSNRTPDLEIAWFRPVGRRRKVYSTRIIVVS